MSTHSTEFEATEGGLMLANAILLYRSGSGAPVAGAPAFASIHPIDDSDSVPTIGAGRPLTRAHLRQWTEALGKTAAPEILPDNVLVSHSDVLAWWTPQQVRPGYFALTRPPKTLKALGSRIVVPVPYPAHLFVASRSGLGVYALPDNRRPAHDTPLLHSPILNVFVEGKLCWGDIARPKVLAIAAIPEFERAVFESWSTHPNPGQEFSVKGKGGVVELWDDLAARKAKRFPVGRLRPFDAGQRRSAETPPITLGSIIAGSTKQ